MHKTWLRHTPPPPQLARLDRGRERRLENGVVDDLLEFLNPLLHGPRETSREPGAEVKDLYSNSNAHRREERIVGVPCLVEGSTESRLLKLKGEPE